MAVLLINCDTKGLTINEVPYKEATIRIEIGPNINQIKDNVMPNALNYYTSQASRLAGQSALNMLKSPYLAVPSLPTSMPVNLAQWPMPANSYADFAEYLSQGTAWVSDVVMQRILSEWLDDQGNPIWDVSEVSVVE